ncbi:MAG: hypothetical protein ACR2GK_02080 [Gemmatimonadaceae bacterium]
MVKSMFDLAERFRSVIVSYPDWPKPGVTFADLSPVYAGPDLRRELTAHFSTAPRTAAGSASATFAFE